MSDKDWFESMPSPFVKPAATVHGTGSGKPLCKGPVDSDGYHCICSNYHEHNGKCRHHNQVFHNMPTSPASSKVTLDRESLIVKLREIYNSKDWLTVRNKVEELLALIFKEETCQKERHERRG